MIHFLIPVPSLKETRIPIWFLLSLCVSATAWLYVHQVLEPWVNAKDVREGELKARMGDLYPRWVGTRELFLNRRNPYSPEVSHEIQMAYYGHIVTAEDVSGHVVDEERFVYPIYVVFLMAPTIFTDFANVHFWAPFVLAGFAVLTVLFSVRVLDWHLPWTAAAALVLFILSSPQIAQGIRQQQLALVVACLLTAGACLVHDGHLGSAGALLAFSTIKPQMALLPLIWFLLWAAGEWRARWRLFAGFGVTISLLVGIGEWLVPGWMGDFFAAVAAYRKYYPTTSLPRLLLGDAIGIVVSCIIVVWLLILGWKNRKRARDSRQFALVVAAFLMGTVLAFPLFTPFNQVLLILPAVLLVREWARISMPGRVIFIGLVAWPWVTSLGLLLLRPPLNPASQLPLLPALTAFAAPLLLPALLFMTCRGPRAQVGIRQAD